ncbi:MAG: DUF2281 domain-containing protein [Nitrospinae bacterium]|nr:DUF2281 domain-containing protein [Nitrospinota bacterium]
MTIPEEIYHQVQHMPETLQAEVLDFVEYLEFKKIKPLNGEKEIDWSAFSLVNAMQGMEDEDTLYSIDDLKERFS